MDDNLNALPWFAEVMDLVRERFAEIRVGQRDMRPDLQHEYRQLEANSKGWSASLANPNLATTLRRNIEEQYGGALERMEEIEAILVEQDAQNDHADTLVNPDEVLDRLRSLADVLSDNNPTLGNLELSLHIDKIICSPDGVVVMRTCKLGGLTDVVEMLVEEGGLIGASNGTEPSAQTATPRRRGRPRLGDADDDRDELRTLAEFASDTNRFAGLPDEWFWHDEFVIPERVWPFQEIAIDVATDRRSGLTHEQLAKKYGVTTPTIRKSLKHARAIDERFHNMPKKVARSRWHEVYAADVAAMKKSAGLSTLQLAEHFGKSDTTIRAALNHAKQQQAHD